MTSKIALCLSGKIGNTKGKSGYFESDPRILNVGHEHYKKHIIDKNEVDLFIHCWDTNLKDNIIEKYNPKKYIIEKQIKFKIPSYVMGEKKRCQNHYSRWYSNKIVNKLRREYEIENNFKYEFVMTSRFDLAFETDIIFNNYNNKYFYAGKWSKVSNKLGKDLFKGGRGPLYSLMRINGRIINTLNLTNIGYPDTKDGLLDLWFFSNSDYSTEFFNLYDYLDEYNKPGNCPTDSNNTISNHQLSLYHLKKLDYIKNIKFELDMFDDFPEVRRKYFHCKK